MEGEIREVFRAAARIAEAGEPGALAIVIRVRGSAPQRVGAKLALRRDGRFVGTVGGGAVEAAVLADAAAVRDGGNAGVRTYRLGAELGMCCGGTMDVFIEPIAAGSARPFAEAWRLAQDGAAGAVGVVVSSSVGGPRIGAKAVVSRDGVVAEDLDGGPLWEAIRRDVAAAASRSEPGVASLIAPGGHEVELYVEPIEARPRLVIFGGGHVAQPLAAVAAMLGFRVIVVDEREDWANRERFPEADEIANEPFVDFLQHFEHRPEDFLVIVTRGHEFDQSVLEAVIDKDFRYLGLIGSRAKIKRTFLRLEAAGVIPQLLERVHAPIGLNVGAQTPQEIAVSIGAELVMVRRGVQRAQTGTPAWWREKER